MQAADDSALLRQYAESNSEAAFAALVTRYVNLVHSVALRDVGNSHDAEEITQAVFIILTRKAGKLRHRKTLSSWLFEATHLTANNFVRSEMRRHRREEEAHMQSVLNESGIEGWQQIAPLLDAGVMALRERERQVILLRFFENRSLREVGLALDASEDAVEKRVSRALEKLRRFFARRGVTLSAPTIAGAVSTNSIHAAPAGLANTISAVALAKGAAVSGSTLTLVKGALKLMALAKAKTAIVAGVTAILAAGTATVVLKQVIPTGHSKHSSAMTAPEFQDLGVVEVSDGTPIHEDLGGGRACVITPTVFKDGSVTLAIVIEETNSVGVVRTLATPRVHNMAGQQMAVSVGDIGIRVTPQIKP